MACHATHARNASDDFLLSASAHISSPDSKPRRSQCSLQPPRRHFFIMFSLRPATSDFHQVSFSVFIASLLRYHQSCVQRNASYFIITTRRDLISPTRYLPVCFHHPDDARLFLQEPSSLQHAAGGSESEEAAARASEERSKMRGGGDRQDRDEICPRVPAVTHACPPLHQCPP